MFDALRQTLCTLAGDVRAAWSWCWCARGCCVYVQKGHEVLVFFVFVDFFFQVLSVLFCLFCLFCLCFCFVLSVRLFVRCSDVYMFVYLFLCTYVRACVLVCKRTVSRVYGSVEKTTPSQRNHNHIFMILHRQATKRLSEQKKHSFASIPPPPPLPRLLPAFFRFTPPLLIMPAISDRWAPSSLRGTWKATEVSTTSRTRAERYPPPWTCRSRCQGGSVRRWGGYLMKKKSAEISGKFPHRQESYIDVGNEFDTILICERKTCWVRVRYR